MSEDPTVTPRPATSLSSRPDNRAGFALLKAEYIIQHIPIVESTSTSELNSTTAHLDVDDLAEGRSESQDSRNNKRRKADKKAKKGQNKAREFPHVREAGARICRVWETTGVCERGGESGDCRYAHDWSSFFGVKNPDVSYDPKAILNVETPYVAEEVRGVGGEDVVGTTIDTKTACPVYRDLGYCQFGWRCRFLGGHVRRVGSEEGSEVDQGFKDGATRRLGGWELISETKKESEEIWRNGETNWANQNVISTLRGGGYKFPFTEAYLKVVEPDKPFDLTRKIKSQPVRRPAPPPAPVDEESAMNEDSEETAMNVLVETVGNAVDTVKGLVYGESEALDVPLRPEEKKRLNWRGELYLAPLTTVGNLPFRRLCTTYGATITCSEMALAQPLVVGHTEEWALLRRHEAENTFGIQLAGGYANWMVPAAELIRKEIGSGVDFVDVNLGCPIDLVFNQGAGSALMDSANRLGKILVGMNRALGDIPLTVKFRTGVANNKPNAHKLIPRFVKEWGAGAMTLHGRSRQQRYSKLADWDYIKTCATTLRETLADEGLPPVPIFGNGDCFSAQSYYEEMEKSGVDGVMVARGALIKPWIFTEIKERREWDISATERLEGIRKFAEFGLTHWGSDTQGLNITRRFLCESLSFQHRYIPIGLLEKLPPKLNERPPAYRGRNELETLLSSPFSGDWVKISEMFLGKVDDGFKFLPKHKSNAYDGEVAQG